MGTTTVTQGPQVLKAPAKKPSSYIPALDGLRALAFLMVFLSHTTGNTIGRYVPAAFGVTVFFFLSGYLITTLLRKEWQETATIALKDFYIRRALRIFIPLYITYALASLLVHFTGDPQGNWRGFWAAMTYTYNYTRLLPHVALPNGMDLIWSLSVEEHFYLLFPLFFLFLMRKRMTSSAQAWVLFALCLVVIPWRLFVWTHHFPEAWTYFATDCRYDSILWGSLLALWNNPRFDTPISLLKRQGGTLALAGLAVLVASMFVGSETYRFVYRTSFQGLCLYLIFYFAVSTTGHWSVRWLENRALRYVGWLSYSLYLSHRALQWVVVRYVSHKDWIVVPLTFVLAFVYAYAMRQLLELPIQRLRAKYRHVEPPVSASMPVEGI